MQSPTALFVVPHDLVQGCIMWRRLAMLLVLATAFLVANFAARSQVRRQAAPDAPIDDLTIPADAILKLSPDAAKIERLLTPLWPTHRIIHIADWHYVSRERFRNYHRLRTDEGYTEYVHDLEELRAAQYRLLHMLVDRHGLRQVFAEGESIESLDRCARAIDWLRRAEAMGDGNELRERLRAAIDQADANGEDSTGIRKQEQLLEVANGYRLNLGAAHELAAASPCVDILPTENRIAFKAALQAGEWVALNATREDAIVTNLLHVPCAVIVLGGGHDLSSAIKRIGGGRCEYLKVSVAGESALLDFFTSHFAVKRTYVKNFIRISRGPFADKQTALVSLSITIFFVLLASRIFAREVPKDEEASMPDS